MSASSGLSGDKPVTIFPRSPCETLHHRRGSFVSDTMTTGSRRDSGDPVRIFPAQPPARGPCAARQALPGADNSPRLGPYHIYASGPRAPHAQREDEPKLEHARAESEQGQALPLQPTRRTPPESSYPHISLNGANLTRRAQTQDISMDSDLVQRSIISAPFDNSYGSRNIRARHDYKDTGASRSRSSPPRRTPSPPRDYRLHQNTRGRSPQRSCSPHRHPDHGRIPHPAGSRLAGGGGGIYAPGPQGQHAA